MTAVTARDACQLVPRFIHPHAPAESPPLLAERRLEQILRGGASPGDRRRPTGRSRSPVIGEAHTEPRNAAPHAPESRRLVVYVSLGVLIMQQSDSTSPRAAKRAPKRVRQPAVVAPSHDVSTPSPRPRAPPPRTVWLEGGASRPLPCPLPVPTRLPSGSHESVLCVCGSVLCSLALFLDSGETGSRGVLMVLSDSFHLKRHSRGPPRCRHEQQGPVLGVHVPPAPLSSLGGHLGGLRAPATANNAPRNTGGEMPLQTSVPDFSGQKPRDCWVLG